MKSNNCKQQKQRMTFQHINLGCLCYFISYESFLCKIQFQLLSNTEAKGMYGMYVCILELRMHAIFFILFLCVGSLHCSSPKLLGCLAQERSAQSVNKMWIELVFVPEVSFDPFSSIQTHVSSSVQDGSNQAYWVHIIWSQLVE
jgi:hypothetical protein